MQFIWFILLKSSLCFDFFFWRESHPNQFTWNTSLRLDFALRMPLQMHTLVLKESDSSECNWSSMLRGMNSCLKTWAGCQKFFNCTILNGWFTPLKLIKDTFMIIKRKYYFFAENWYGALTDSCFWLKNVLLAKLNGPFARSFFRYFHFLS